METYFDGQRDNERLLLVWRRHPWTLLRPGLLVTVLTLLIVAALVSQGASLASSLAIALWLIAVPPIIGITWFRWWNDLYLLTNQRLIDIDQKGLFHRAVAEAPLVNIQDVSFEVRGPIQTLLNFGIVIVQTASVSTEISMEGVTDPQAVQQAILRAAQATRGNRRLGSDSERTAKTRTQLG